MIYSLVFTIYSLIFMTMLLITLIIKVKKKPVRTKLYILLIMFSMICGIMEVVAIYTLCYIDPIKDKLAVNWELKNVNMFFYIFMFILYSLVVLRGTKAQGLKEYNMLSAEDEENLARLSELARQLQTISNKELKNESLSDEEYELIKTYGGNIEHFWYDAIKDEAGTEYISADEFPAAIVVDIATNPNGEVLEVATGNPSRIYVVVNVEGQLKIASGSVYSFYQFTQPIDSRLTDSEWRYMMGIQCDEDGRYNWDNKIDQPSWTNSYRYNWD